MIHVKATTGKQRGSRRLRARRVAADSPRYSLVAAEIERRIASGKLKPGMRIAGENELARTFGVSRVTIRAALDIVEGKGLVIRRPGAGTFVALPRLHHDLTVLESLFVQFTKQGIHASTRLLEYRWSAIDPQTARDLPYSEAMKLSRLWLIGRVPFAVTHSYLHPATRAISYAEAERQPGYRMLEGLGLHIARADLRLGAERPKKAIAQVLGLSLTDPILVLQRTSYAKTGEPLEHTTCYCRSDAIEFALSVRGRISLSEAFKRRSIVRRPPSSSRAGGSY